MKAVKAAAIRLPPFCILVRLFRPKNPPIPLAYYRLSRHNHGLKHAPD